MSELVNDWLFYPDNSDLFETSDSLEFSVQESSRERCVSWVFFFSASPIGQCPINIKKQGENQNSDVFLHQIVCCYYITLFSLLSVLLQIESTRVGISIEESQIKLKTKPKKQL